LIKQGETREVFWHLPGWAKALWYVLTLISVAVFAWGVIKPYLKYRRGRGGYVPPRRELPGRIRAAARTTLTHARIAKRDRYAGVAHAAIFYGFVVLFIGTVVLAVDTDFTEPVFGWKFFSGDFYVTYSFVLDALGVVFLAGVLAMMIRRGFIRPRKLTYRAGDWIFVGGLLYLLLTGYLLEGVRLAMDTPGNEAANPAGWAAGQLMGGLSSDVLSVLRHTIWWSHGVVALAFVAALPYTKGMHVLTSFATLVLADPKAGKRLRLIPPERADEPAGYARLEDFMPVHLLQLDGCTKCGKCHDVCPANATGQPLSPRDVILGLRDQVKEGPIALPAATVWSCYQCNACVEVCPVGIEQAPIINQVRRSLVEQGEMPADLQSTLRVITKSGNSFGENRRRRGRWTDELDFDVKDARTAPVDVLWFVGDYASFDPRGQEISRTLARLYDAAALDFGILYDGERNSGNDVRRAGEEGLWEALAGSNISALEEADFQRIVTSDPHSLNTLRNEYPDVTGHDWRVSHHTGLLLELLESGRLPVHSDLGYRVTYHDPCYLGRHNGEYDAPRRILELLGCELVEMPRNRENSFCCGAGGGRIWVRDDPAAERPSENRIREAVGLGRLDYFVVSCPKDVTMYEDAIKTTGQSDHLQLKELTELVAEACDVRSHGNPQRKTLVPGAER
jgi:Fe-S oxidoreductase/nitrate reductase gamma subunit